MPGLLSQQLPRTRRPVPSNGTADVLTAAFRAELSNAGYPADWLNMVVCRFGSKEVVDRDYEGSYFHFLQ